MQTIGIMRCDYNGGTLLIPDDALTTKDIAYEEGRKRQPTLGRGWQWQRRSDSYKVIEVTDEGGLPTPV